MRKVTQNEVDDLMSFAKEHVPDLEIIYKDEKAPTWWIQLIYWGAALIGMLSKDFKYRWNNRISNAFGKKYLAFPTRKDYEDLSNYGTYMIFRHELVHLMDSRRWGVLFPLSYALFLPTIYTFRAHWEFRGYAQNLIVRWEQTGEISESSVDWIEAQFCSSLYVWMWPFKKGVRKRLDNLVAGIKTGKVSGYYPDIKWTFFS